VILVVVIAVVIAAFTWWRQAIGAHPATPTGQQIQQGSPTNTTPSIERASTGVGVYGGSADEFFASLAINGDGSIIAAGSASSSDGDFPVQNSNDTLLAKLTAQGELVWTASMGGTGNDSFYGVAINADGTIIAAGSTDSVDGDLPVDAGNGEDALLAKYSADGELIWAKTFGGDGTDSFTAVAISPDGAIVAAGSTSSTSGSFPATGGAQSVLLAKFSPDGDMDWAQISGTDGMDDFDTVAVDADGSIVTAGSIQATNDAFDPIDSSAGNAVIAKYTSSGQLLWASTFTDGAMATYYSVTILSDDSVMAAGMTIDQALLARYSSDGHELWTTQVADPANAWFTATSLTVNDSIVAVGNVLLPNTDTTWVQVAQFSEDGQQTWAKTYGGTGDSALWGAKVTADGNIIAVGSTDSSDGDFPATHGGMDALVVRLDGNGSLG